MPYISKNTFGFLFECIATMLLVLKGYAILKRRYKVAQGEIDIIARKGNMIIFVEAKARKKHFNYYPPVRYNQIRRIQNAANIFLMKHKLYNKVPIRFDVFLLSGLSIKHIKNVW